MKHSKKTCIVGDSHIRRIKKNLFNDSITEGKAHFNSFSGATINRLGRRSTGHIDNPCKLE